MKLINERYREKLRDSSMVLVQPQRRDWLLCGAMFPTGSTSELLCIHPCIRIFTNLDLFAALAKGLIKVDSESPLITIAEVPIYISWGHIELMADLSLKWREKLLTILTDNEGSRETSR
jgi:hypothetical protein